MAALVVFMVGLRFKSYYKKIRRYIFWGEFVSVCTYMRVMMMMMMNNNRIEIQML